MDDSFYTDVVVAEVVTRALLNDPTRRGKLTNLAVDQVRTADMGYWGDTRLPENGTPISWIVMPAEPGDFDEKEVSWKDIVKAMVRIMIGQVKVNSAIRGWVITDLTSGEWIEGDATSADVVVQVAMFGEIVYG